jgi:opacity protein-like surface antigen
MKNAIRTLALAATLAGTLSTPAAAQLEPPVGGRSNTAGFHLGVFLNGSAVQVEDSDIVEKGGGGSLHLGYGPSQNVSVFMRANAAEIESDDADGSYILAHFDIGARYSFASAAAALRPFVQGAFSGRAFSLDAGAAGTLEARGPGFTAGAGVEYFFNPQVALEAGLSYSFGEFNEGRLDGGEWVDFEDEAFSATSSRIDVGISWHP